MKFFIIVLIYFLAGCSGAKYNPSQINSSQGHSGIFKGQLVAEDSSIRPYVVAVYTTDINDWSRSTCTGTFISESTVLTAAHCIGRDSNKVHQLIYDLSPAENMRSGKPVQQLAIGSIIIHEKYIFGSHIHDIAIIKFSGGLPEGAKVASIAKSFRNDQPVVIAGYGDSEEEQQKYSGHGILRSLKVTMQEFPEKDFGIVDKYKNKLVIMDQENGGACFGDSGGPAFQIQTGLIFNLVGVDAFVAPGLKTAKSLCHGTGAYTDVGTYRDWIEARM